MQNAANTTAELTQDQQDALRSLLDSEILLIGGGDSIICLN